MKCGVGDYVERLAHSLTERGEEVHVVTSAYARIPATTCSPYVHPVVGSWKATRIRPVVRYIRSLRPDIIHFQYPTSEYKHFLGTNLLPGLLKLVEPRLPIVETHHEPVASLTWKGKVRHLPNLAVADALVYVDEAYAGTLPLPHRLLSRMTTEVAIPIASNIPTYCNDTQTLEESRVELGKGDGPLLAYFGFINPPKGFELVLEVTKLIGARLIVIGQLDENDQYHKRIIGLIERLGLTDSVIVLGFQKPQDVAKYLRVADACVFPFVDGVSPKNGSFLAAVAQGTFTVTTSKERRGYDPRENVCYVAPGDVNGMVACLKSHCGHHVEPNPKTWPSWGEVAARHQDLYRQLRGE